MAKVPLRNAWVFEKNFSTPHVFKDTRAIEVPFLHVHIVGMCSKADVRAPEKRVRQIHEEVLRSKTRKKSPRSQVSI